MEESLSHDIGPMVSIIIPVYNGEKHLEQTIESALAQTWRNTEIIIVDDGSDDTSVEIANSFDNRMIRVFQLSHTGAASARNKGLAEAWGRYIQFLDADDLISPDKIEQQVIALEKQPGALAVCSTVHFFNDHFSDDLKPSPYEEQFIYNTDQPVNFVINLWGGNNFEASMVQPNAWLTPMETIVKAGGWDESLTIDDDGEFFARVILNSSNIIKTGGYNYYRKHNTTSTNLSAQNSKLALTSAFRAVLLKKEALFQYNTSEAAHKAIYKQLKELAIKCYTVQPELYKLIASELKGFKDYKYTPKMGGRLINIVSQHISWKLARKLQTIRRK